MTKDSEKATMVSLIEAGARAIGSKDADAALSPCAPDFVRYDLAPPLGRTGAAALDRDRLIGWFETWRGPIRYELKDFAITVSGDIAFGHGFLRLAGTHIPPHPPGPLPPPP